MADPLFRNPNPEEPFREPIAKLAKLITDRTPVVLGLEKIDKESPEYIGLSMMCTDEMAEMALLMEKRKPKTLEDMVRISGKDREYVEEIREICGGKGVCHYGKLPPNAEGQANLIPDIQKVKEKTGWRPEVGFKDGIRRMIRC